MSFFETQCPRLARAHRERCVEMGQEMEARRRCRYRLLKAEKLVAHRDLQLQRAFVRGQRGYIEVRARKLKAAQKELAYWQRRAARLGL